MKFGSLIIILTLVMWSGLSAQEGALSDRIASYDISLKLDTATKQISAKEVLYWTNPSQDTIRELQFHLYYNAFRNNRSTFMADRGGFDFLSHPDEEGKKWAWMEMLSIVDEAGNELRPNAKYIQPDDDNAEDKTVMSVPLATPVLPNESIKLDIDWASKVPNIAVRTGYNKEYYFMAQWFPKVGVYEPAGMRYSEEGQWNCHQYHAAGEYYSNFGNYNVTIEVPKGYVVGSSGQLMEERETEESYICRYYVEDVIDFTWTTSPHFVVQKTKWKDVELKLLTYPGHEHFAERYFRTVKNALEYLGEHLGPYPYPTLTIVDPPIHGLFTGGMEYPTLVSSISFCFFPVGIKTPETLVTHEFVHQYFMQMIATNEQEEPWMDEGFTTYYEGRILDHYEGVNTATIDAWGIKSGNVEFNRAEFFMMDNPKIADTDRFSWEYNHGGYGTIAYNKTAMWLKTLEGLVGIETMDEILKTYFDRWKFKHPCGEDFFAIVNEIVPKNHGDEFGENMDWFFEQVYYGSDVCDYTVASIDNEAAITPKDGFFEDVNNYVAPPKEEAEIDEYKSTVVLHRLGEMYMPVDVAITFDNGSTKLEKWDGQARSHEFSYISPNKIVSAEVDPKRKINMDKNFINNSLTVEVQRKGIRKYFYQFMVGVQNILQSISALV